MNRTIIIYGSIVLIVLIVLFVTLKRVGLIKSKEQRKNKKIEDKQEGKEITVSTDINSAKYFKPSYYKSSKSVNLLTPIASDNAARTIEEAFGVFNDDEEQIFGVFRNLTNKVQVSQIAASYLKLFNTDLASELIQRLGKSEQVILFNITESLK
jgi:hypothetical protein